MTSFYFIAPGAYLLLLLLAASTRQSKLDWRWIAGFFLTTFAWGLFVKYAEKNSAVTVAEASVTSNNGFFGRTSLKYSEISRMKRVRGKIGGLYLFNAEGDRIILSDGIIGYERLEKIIAGKRPDLSVE